MAKRRHRRGKPLPTEPVEITIDSLSHEGRGVGRIEGKTVFVDRALPGETVQMKYTFQRGKFDEGRTISVENPNPQRVTPPCEHFGVCGGCSMQHLSTDAQIDHKQSILAEQLKHFANTAPNQWLAPLQADLKAYRRKARGGADENEHLAKATFYLLPLWGILHRSLQDPGQFLGLDLWVLPVPALAVDIVGMAAMASLVWWAGTRITAWWQGRLAVAHTLFMISHFAIFGIGYVVIDSIDAGWLVLNIWHNIQYILFVWLFNNSRFRDGVSAKARFLSRLSQSRNFWAYGLVCFGISTFAYITLNSFVVALVPAIVVYQTINFHHYLVDGAIWKMRKKPMRKTLGLAH